MNRAAPKNRREWCLREIAGMIAIGPRISAEERADRIEIMLLKIKQIDKEVMEGGVK